MAIKAIYKKGEKKRFLTRRVKCSRRALHNMPPIEQSARSCMAAYYLANIETKRRVNFATGAAGHSFAQALQKCKSCPQGKKLYDSFTKKFGEKFNPNYDTPASVRANTKARAAETRSWPETTPAMLARDSIPADFYFNHQQGRRN